MRDHLEPEIETPKRSGINPSLTGLLGLVAGLVLGLIVGFAVPKTSSRIVAGSPTLLKPIVIETTVNGQVMRIVGKPMGDVSGSSRYSIGNPNAKITMTEFADFKCGYCRLFATQILNQIKKEYIDPGKVRFVYRDMITVGGNEAVRAANAAACVNEAGTTKYWDFHNLLYGAAHDSWASLSGVNLDNKLIEIASGIGGNPDGVKTCLNAQKYMNEVKIDNQLGADLELGGTPAFVVGGYFFSGALPLEAWREVFKALGVA
jgi:protein-disulfide isomerase